MLKHRRLTESTAACDSLREQLEALLEEADLAAGRGDVERVKSILAKSRFDDDDFRHLRKLLWRINNC